MTSSERKCAAALLRIMPLKKYFEVIKISIMMQTYSRRKPIIFMYFWLNYIDKGHVERIPIAMKNIGYLLRRATEIIEVDRLRFFLFFDGTQIDNNEYLESLETCSELIVVTEEQI